MNDDDDAIYLYLKDRRGPVKVKDLISWMLNDDDDQWSLGRDSLGWYEWSDPLTLTQHQLYSRKYPPEIKIKPPEPNGQSASTSTRYDCPQTKDSRRRLQRAID